MHAQNNTSLGLFSCKLKPISLIIFSLFAQVAYSQETNSVEAMTGETANAVKPVELPSVASQYGATKEILKTAAASDAQAQGTGKTDSQGKPIGNKPVDINLKAVTVRAKRFHEVGPLPGLGLTKDEIPGNVQSITAKEIKESHSLSLTDLMNKKLQSVNVNDYQGNPFMMDVTYRGFTAGPQIGTPQGLSVFFDGIRVNEPFGDVVNWDLIPMNALAGVDVFPGSNPIFGLGTLGGAFTVKTKDGFNHEGVDAEILTGSYGRKQLQVTGGTNNGTFALFGAGNFFLEDGWRDNSPSKVNQFFGKASYRGEKLDLNLSTLLVSTDLVGNGLLPSEMYAQSHSSVFSSPDTTKNTLQQFQLSGAFQVNDNFNITGQVYRRDSKRHSVGADVYTDWDNKSYVRKNLNKGEEITCLFNSSGNAAKYGIPNYYVIDHSSPDENDAHPFFSDPTTGLFATGVPDYTLIVGTGNLESKLNPVIPEGVWQAAKEDFNFAKNFWQKAAFQSGTPAPESAQAPKASDLYSNAKTDDYLYEFNYGGNAVTYLTLFQPGISLVDALNLTYYYTKDPDHPGQGIKHTLIVLPPDNISKCDLNASAASNEFNVDKYAEDDPLFPSQQKLAVAVGGNQPGVVEGTPTAVLTDNNINQITDGASVQLNWNLEHHKFMIGASIDRPTATYSNEQKLGMLDAQRNASLAPDEIRDQYSLADIGVRNNDFSGSSTTKSIYASETWSPVETLHLTGALRYNATHGKNKIAARGWGSSYIPSLDHYENFPNSYDLILNGVRPPTGYTLPDLARVLNKAEEEKFSYYSLNPSLGATWQAKENLNVYGNWAQGTRTPSVIELGCALDKRPVYGYNANGVILEPFIQADGTLSPNLGMKSVVENRECSLPSSLSGDPYLPQIKAQTYELGARGTLHSMLGAENLEWNLSVYQTNLRDDIYYVATNNGAGFFDSIGKTRRRGLEAGIGGALGKARFKLNYALTDATFEDRFRTLSTSNSSFASNTEVEPGDRMPGVPLHNLNASLSFNLTSKWNIGLSAVAHSGTYLRNNENNEHQPGGVFGIADPSQGTLPLRTSGNNKGTLPGYATFNLQTSYQFNNEWTAGIQVTNLLNKEYFSAGRLGISPFATTPEGRGGAVGPSGYNYNMNNWLSTNFIAPGAPRGVWFSLNWQFDPKK